MKNILAGFTVFFLAATALATPVKHGASTQPVDDKVPEGPCEYLQRVWKADNRAGNPKIWVRGDRATIEVLGPKSINVTTYSGRNKTWELEDLSRSSTSPEFKISDDKMPFGPKKEWWQSSGDPDGQGAAKQRLNFDKRFEALKTAWSDVVKNEDPAENEWQKAAVRCATTAIDKADGA